MNDILFLNHSEKPMYRQLSEQIASQIINGDLPAGFKLPAIRTIAKELRVSVITVKKAWEELERQELILTTPGRGCFVAALKGTSLQKKQNLIAENQLKIDLEFYKTLGLEVDELKCLIDKIYPEI